MQSTKKKNWEAACEWKKWRAVIDSGKNGNILGGNSFAYFCWFMFIFPWCTKWKRTFLSCALIVKTLYCEDKRDSTDCISLQHRFSVKWGTVFLGGFFDLSRPNSSLTSFGLFQLLDPETYFNTKSFVKLLDRHCNSLFTKKPWIRTVRTVNVRS